MQTQSITHEQFVGLVADIACSRLASDKKAICQAIKLTYGAGPDGVRGVTYYKRWDNGSLEPMPFVAINAIHQESLVQLAGTTIHELGHVLAGWGAGHGKLWKDACEELGLRKIHAAGTQYQRVMFSPDIRSLIAEHEAHVKDGKPVSLMTGVGRGFTLKPCNAGIGTRGGKSRGVGSGSRLRLFECECVPPMKVRIARDTFNCTCNDCASLFHRA